MSTQNQIRFQALQDNHDADAFTCSEDALVAWLKCIERQHISKGVSRTFVAVDPADPARILGYYSLTVAEIDTDKLPKDIAKNCLDACRWYCSLASQPKPRRADRASARCHRRMRCAILFVSRTA